MLCVWSINNSIDPAVIVFLEQFVCVCVCVCVCMLKAQISPYYNFIYFCFLFWVFIAVSGFSLVAAHGL